MYIYPFSVSTPFGKGRNCEKLLSFFKNRYIIKETTDCNSMKEAFMGFWIFMLLMDLLIPLTMIGFGRYFIKNTSKEINALFGYRTCMSMKNKDTWEFAHKYCGKIWYACGLIILPITVIFMLLVIGKSNDYVGTAGGIICGIQLIPLIGSVFPTEITLKRIFDHNGKRRN